MKIGVIEGCIIAAAIVMHMSAWGHMNACSDETSSDALLKQNKLSEKEVTWHYTMAPPLCGLPYVR